MPAPRWLARFNKRVWNRITGPVAPRLPGFGVVVHVGRKTHRQYRTPVNVFRTDDGFVIALTYGKGSNWVQNVLAAGGCRLETGGRAWRLTNPRLVHDRRHRLVPPPVGIVLGVMSVDDVLE
ncbi:MAG: nitroreductase family deazaflavin-dependent oxidoreductase [Dehalococcoidia bacterium]